MGKIAVRVLVMIHFNGITPRDPRTKTCWFRTERFGPGPRTGPEQDRKNLRNLRPARTRTKTILEIPDQDQEKFLNLGLNRTKTEKKFKTWDRTGPGPRKNSKSRAGPD